LTANLTAERMNDDVQTVEPRHRTLEISMPGAGLEPARSFRSRGF